MKHSIAFILILSLLSSTFISATEASTFDTYLATKKFLYVWSYPNADNFLKFVKDHKFTRVYLYVGCIEWDYDNLSQGKFYNAGNKDAKELIQTLLDMGVEVEPTIYLNDSPNNFANVELIEDVAKAMAELQKTLKFKALHFDIEPSSTGLYEKLLKMYENARQYLKVSAILKPGWLNTKMADLKAKFTDEAYYNKFADQVTLIDALMEVTDYSDLMAYNKNYETVDTFLSKYDVIRKRHPNHEGKPVFELDPNVTNDSLYTQFAADHDTFFTYLAKVSKEWDGITIHQYQVWYQDLYCVKPKKDTAYYYGEPKTC